MTKWFLPLLYLAIGLITAGTLMIAVATEMLSRRQEHDILVGLGHPALALDHFLALVLIGLWAGRLRGLYLRALPGSLVTGMAAGFLLAAPRPLAPVEPVIELAMLVALLGLAIAAFLPLRLSVQQAMSLLLPLGALHGCTDRVEAGRVLEPMFLLGYLATAVTLLTIGVGAGLAVPSASEGPVTRT